MVMQLIDVDQEKSGRWIYNTIVLRASNMPNNNRSGKQQKSASVVCIVFGDAQIRGVKQIERLKTVRNR